MKDYVYYLLYCAAVLNTASPSLSIILEEEESMRVEEERDEIY